MRAVGAMLAYSARKMRALMLAVAALLAALQVLLVFSARSLQEMDTFPKFMELIPDFLRQIFGPSLLTMMSFRGIACLAYFHVAILSVLVGLMIAIATEPAGEAETKFLDLILSHPLARHWIIIRSVILLILCSALVLGAMMLGMRIGFKWLMAEDLGAATFEVVPTLTLNLGLLLLSWGAIALAWTTATKRRSVAASVTAMIAMTSYMVDLISQVWKPLEPFARYSPFHYYQPLNLITGSTNAGHDMRILLFISAGGFLLAWLVFRQRDL